MRIRTLELLAVGPFSNRILDLCAPLPERPGLHCIFGPNEAGKSSGLRALKAWLFGFPERSVDAFHHSGPQLQVGGRLQLDNGRELEFFRRKKRSADLVDRAGAPLSHTELELFLRGLDQALFESLYGIDHQALIQGGRELLAERGELGRILFAAGSGSRSLHGLLRQLSSRADGLYRQRAAKPLINSGIRRHRELQQEIRNLSLAPEAWLAQEQRVRRIASELAELEERRRQADRDRHSLQRLIQAIPLILRRQHQRSRLREFGPLPDLSDDFTTKRQQLTARLQQARLEQEQTQARIRSLRERLEGMPPEGALLDQAGVIDALHLGLGGYTKALRDRPGLESMRAGAEREARHLLIQVAPGHALEQIGDFDAFLHRSRKIQGLAGHYQVVLRDGREADTALAREEKKQEQIRLELAGMQVPDDDGVLLPILRKARTQGELDNTIRLRDGQVRQEKSSLAAALTRLGLWQGDPAAMLDCPMVPVVLVKEFHERFRILDGALAALEARAEQLAMESRTVSEELAALHLGGELIAEADLLAIRHERDQYWLRIRARWLREGGADEEGVEDRELAGIFSELQGRGDQLADRLRREVERIQQHGRLLLRSERLEADRTMLNQERQELRAQKEQLECEWRELWQALAISPRSPAAMLDWLATWRELLVRAEGLERLILERNALCTQRTELCLRLRQILGRGEQSAEQELGPLLVLAEELLERRRAQRAQRLTLEKELREGDERVRELRDRQARASATLTEWHAAWREAGVMLPGREPVSPDDALEQLHLLQQIRERTTEIEGLCKRINGIDRDCKEFAGQVTELMQMLAMELPAGSQELATESAVRLLHERLGAAQQARTLRQTYAAEQEVLEKQAADLEVEIRELARRELELLTRAGCTNGEEAARIERLVLEKRQLMGQLAQLEEDLVRIAGHRDLDQLEEQIAAVDPDALPARLADLNRQIEQDFDPQLRSLLEQLGRERKVLEQMDGGAAAALAAEEQQLNLASLRDGVERFIALRLAMALLRQQIERYRRDNQGPVLQGTAEFFSRMTLGSFSGVATDFDEAGNPVLVALRPDGDRLGVEALSTGTRDQLYLALRLATLEQRRGTGESMPFILDDILINFDGERSRATLEILAAMGEHNQVILFTHNSQVAAMAEDLGAAATLHRL